MNLESREVDRKPKFPDQKLVDPGLLAIDLGAKRTVADLSPAVRTILGDFTLDNVDDIKKEQDSDALPTKKLGARDVRNDDMRKESKDSEHKPMRTLDELEKLAQSVRAGRTFNEEAQQKFKDAIATAQKEGRVYFAQHAIDKFATTLSDMGHKDQSLTELHRFIRSNPEFRDTRHYLDLRDRIDPMPSNFPGNFEPNWWAKRDTEVLVKDTERFGLTPELRKSWEDSLARAKADHLNAYEDMRKGYIDALAKNGHKEDALRDLAVFTKREGLGIESEWYVSKRNQLDPSRIQAKDVRVHDRTKDFELLVREIGKLGMTDSLKKEWDQAVQHAYLHRSDQRWDSLNQTVIAEHVRRLTDTNKQEALAELRKFVDRDFRQGRDSQFYKENLAKIFPPKPGDSKDLHQARIDFELLKIDGGGDPKWKQLAKNLESMGQEESKSLAIEVRKRHIESAAHTDDKHAVRVGRLAELMEFTDKHPKIKEDSWYKTMRDAAIKVPAGVDAERWSKWMEMQALTHRVRQVGPDERTKREIEDRLAGAKKYDPQLFARATEEYLSALIQKGETTYAKRQLEIHRKDFGQSAWFRELEKQSKGELVKNALTTKEQAKLSELAQSLAFLEKPKSLQALVSADAEAIRKGDVEAFITTFKDLKLDDSYLAAVNRELREQGSPIELTIPSRTSVLGLSKDHARVLSVDNGKEITTWWVENGQPAKKLEVRPVPRLDQLPSPDHSGTVQPPHTGGHELPPKEK